MKIQLIAITTLIAFAAPGLAAAQNPPITPYLTVRYNDLDLQKARDAETMLHRIRKVAIEICQPGETGFGGIERFQTCYHKTVDQAVTELGAPRVTEALNSTGGERRLAGLH